MAVQEPLYRFFECAGYLWPCPPSCNSFLWSPDLLSATISCAAWFQAAGSDFSSDNEETSSLDSWMYCNCMPVHVKGNGLKHVFKVQVCLTQRTSTSMLYAMHRNGQRVGEGVASSS